MKEDGRRARGNRTRDAALVKAVAVASTEGIEGLTFGRIASLAEMPKATIQEVFSTRESLQIQTLQYGSARFAAAIQARLDGTLRGMALLRALVSAWFAAVEESAPGGCLVTAIMSELRARPGPLLDALLAEREKWTAALSAAARDAAKSGELAGNIDPDQLVFELLAFQSLANNLRSLGDIKGFQTALTLSLSRLSA